jgi:hypothetical protein
MKLNQTLVALGLGLAAASASAASHDELTFNFSSVPGAGITFTGVVGALPGTILFPNFGAYDFTIDSSNYIVSGVDLLEDLGGNITTAGFTYSHTSSTTLGPITIENGSVTGTGTMTITDHMGNDLLAYLEFSQIVSSSFGSSSGITLGSALMNITPVSYSGSNSALIRMLNSALRSEDPSVVVTAQFNTPPAKSLTQLLLKGAENNTSYSGTFYSAAPIPEPSTYAMLAVGLGMVGFSLARGRRS